MTTKYDKLPIESLSDDQLNDFLDYLDNPFTSERKDSIKNKLSSQKYRKKKPLARKKRRVLIVAAAASLVLLTAFTQRDDLKLLYLKHFGTESEILLANSKRLEFETTDQGLRFKALASFKDGNTTYFLAEFTDLTDNRLSKDTDLFNWQMLNGGNSQVVDYNEQTKTATILTKATQWEKNAPTGYQLTTFLSHKQPFEERVPINLAEYLEVTPAWIDLSKQMAQGGGFNQIAADKIGLEWGALVKSGLKTDVINLPLTTEKALTLSNVGYKDGLLHLQLKEPNTTPSTALFINLIDNQTGKKIDYLADFGVDQETHNNETGRSDYTEYVFDLPKERLKTIDLSIEGWDYGTYQKGNWAIQLKEPQRLPTKKLVDSNLKIAKQSLSLKNISLSPLSLSFDYLPNEREELELTIEIVTTDKQQKELTISTASAQEMPDQLAHFTYEFGYLDLDTVAKVLINGQDIPFY